MTQGVCHRAGRYNAMKAIDRVAHYRRFEMLHMHTNLMRAACFKIAAQIGMHSEALQHLVMRDCRLAAASDCHLGAGTWMPPNRLVHGAVTPYLTPHDCAVFTFHRACLQLAHQAGLRS